MNGNGTIREQKAAEAAVLVKAIATANVDPLPGPLASAFSPPTRNVLGMMVRKPVASDWMTFVFLGSPILKMLALMRQQPEGEIQVEADAAEQWEICWQFTHSREENRNLEAQGREAYRNTAIAQIGDLWDPMAVQLVQVAVVELLGECWKTMIQFSTDSGDDGKKNSTQDSAESRRTVSVGGSMR